MKYVALMCVRVLEISGQWHQPGMDESFYRSPMKHDEESAKKWLTTILKDYPNSIVDGEIIGNKYSIKYSIETAIIAFDEEKSQNYELCIRKYTIIEK